MNIKVINIFIWYLLILSISYIQLSLIEVTNHQRKHHELESVSYHSHV
jgi:hypothetical protein